MGLKVDIATLEGAAQLVAHQAQGAQGIAAEVVATQSGCGSVDAAMGQLIKGWAAQVLALSEVSAGMARSLESAATRYAAADHADANSYKASVAKHGGISDDPSGSIR